ncbi:uncharacterized protein LOC123290962 isoform X2 [Chrysoperla carnea]|uniref:uncharacterized protein LOC123290962 isoform X2 n=1 Tax=Chrysoperla carnea TaxID=189513 RepID=UPI001D064AE8|nr:uncharacterized protein LOC123290962 isoform X2 [Chrysoperla carnea]
MPETVTEHVVMTPKCKTENSTTLIIERRAVEKTSDKMHVAGGDHTGIVINKETVVENGDASPAQLSLEFRVFLVSTQTGKHKQEARTLRFWFKPSLLESEQPSVAQEFFRELVSPQEFPRDYVGFIKKIMKLMQHRYESLKKIEIELKQLDDVEEPPNRPRITNGLPSADDNNEGQIVELTLEKVLELLESAYPNPITIQDLANDNNWDETEVTNILAELTSRGLVKSLENGIAFTRAQQEADQAVTIVKQMPTMASGKQPTIAIITAQYCEKVAVDAMIENKETFVRYTTVGSSPNSPDGDTNTIRRTRYFGESNVYTLGNIGAHRVVSTKLPTVGHSREAMIAAGNTTTRLLGTFQRVDFVLLVGVAGGVPHYTDYSKHVRLGDVVVSAASENKDKKYVYVYCNNARKAENNYEFELKPYSPASDILQTLAKQLKLASEENGAPPPWLDYLSDGLQKLQANNAETDFKAPPVESDKLYMSIGERDLIEVAHPVPSDSSVKRYEGCPRIHLAPIASGRKITRDDQLRQHFSVKTGALAFDGEFDTVIESILGNCRDNFVCIRGIADYKDGSRRKEWQPYASLAAASVMKAIICGMDAPTNV